MENFLVSCKHLCSVAREQCSFYPQAGFQPAGLMMLRKAHRKPIAKRKVPKPRLVALSTTRERGHSPLPPCLRAPTCSGAPHEWEPLMALGSKAKSGQHVWGYFCAENTTWTWYIFSTFSMFRDDSMFMFPLAKWECSRAHLPKLIKIPPTLKQQTLNSWLVSWIRKYILSHNILFWENWGALHFTPLRKPLSKEAKYWSHSQVHYFR